MSLPKLKLTNDQLRQEQPKPTGRVTVAGHFSHTVPNAQSTSTSFAFDNPCSSTDQAWRRTVDVTEAPKELDFGWVGVVDWVCLLNLESPANRLESGLHNDLLIGEAFVLPPGGMFFCKLVEGASFPIIRSTGAAIKVQVMATPKE